MFWPVNKPTFPGAAGTQFEGVSEADYREAYSVWIGLFGDAGQTNQSLPFTSSTEAEYYKQHVKSTATTTKPPYGSITRVIYKPCSTCLPFTWNNEYVQSAQDFYEWLPFQTMPLDFSWRDWAGSQPQVGASSNGDNQPRACVRMVPQNWADVTTHGKQENALCSSTSLGCFCRALCSVADSEACLARRRCSIDGTLIEENYEYDFDACTCKRVEQVRCCSDCSAESTGGRIKPTECRGIVPGDKDYPDAEPMLEEFKDPVLAAAPYNIEERGFKACRRILWGPQKRPINIGDATNTLAPDGLGIGQDRRRMNLPEF